MKIHLLATLLICLATFNSSQAEQPKKKIPPIGVPKDATLFNGNWYRIYFAKVSWTDAKERCKSAGGQLAIIPDEPTQVFVRKFAGEADVWLGATNANGPWKWVDGTPMTFSSWATGQPDNLENKQDCLHMFQGGWDDTSKDAKRVTTYICEWKDK